MSKNQAEATIKSNNHHVPFFVTLLNPAVKGLLHLGVPMGPMTLLTVH